MDFSDKLYLFECRVKNLVESIDSRIRLLLVLFILCFGVVCLRMLAISVSNVSFTASVIIIIFCLLIYMLLRLLSFGGFWYFPDSTSANRSKLDGLIILLVVVYILFNGVFIICGFNIYAFDLSQYEDVILVDRREFVEDEDGFVRTIFVDKHCFANVIFFEDEPAEIMKLREYAYALSPEEYIRNCMTEGGDTLFFSDTNNCVMLSSHNYDEQDCLRLQYGIGPSWHIAIGYSLLECSAYVYSLKALIMDICKFTFVRGLCNLPFWMSTSLIVLSFRKSPVLE